MNFEEQSVARRLIHTLWMVYLNLKQEIIHRIDDKPLQKDMAVLISTILNGLINF